MANQVRQPLRCRRCGSREATPVNVVGMRRPEGKKHMDWTWKASVFLCFPCLADLYLVVSETVEEFARPLPSK